MKPNVQAPGWVTLAGAGPGDPELVPLKTAKRLAQATAVVYDALVHPALLDLAPAGAERHPMGKRAGNTASASQETINRLLARLALAGHRVVRLKGGDPFVFGRGGEEALYLGRLGIGVEVIPGVSAVNGATAAAAIPLTHRGVSRGFAVWPGQADLLDSLPWGPLAHLESTLVFLMAGKSVADIAQRLLAHGAAADLPLALLENGGLVNQRLAQSTLGQAALGVLAPVTGGPALVVVGRVLNVGLELARYLFDEGERNGTDISGVPAAARPLGVAGGWGGGGLAKAANP